MLNVNFIILHVDIVRGRRDPSWHSLFPSLLLENWPMLRVKNKCYRDYSCRKYGHSPFLKMRVLELTLDLYSITYSIPVLRSPELSENASGSRYKIL